MFIFTGTFLAVCFAHCSSPSSAHSVNALRSQRAKLSTLESHALPLGVIVQSVFASPQPVGVIGHSGLGFIAHHAGHSGGCHFVAVVTHSVAVFAHSCVALLALKSSTDFLTTSIASS
jgi:hypothetical protein